MDVVNADQNLLKNSIGNENGDKKTKSYGRKNKRIKDQSGKRGNYVLDKRDKHNDLLFYYYKEQKIIPENEWEDFKATLAIPLPSSFRIQRSLPERDQVLHYMQNKFFGEIAKIAESNPGVHVPQPLSFVPYAFQTNMPRAAVRSHPVLRNLHEFLVNETAIGNISRQEAVSMVPPLLLDIQPHHTVLDACAAPGSKTMQIIELMHENTTHPEGLLVANDIEYDRCYLLVHQTLKRMPTANCVVVNEDSSQLPAFVDAKGKPVLYDRILCDLICSGDGTFRKNPELWVNWDLQKSLHLHKLQQNIARRCIRLLKTGGLMVYSTCSLNPIEDEAVVSHMLRVFKGLIELVDVSEKLPELKRSPGISTWKVFNRKMEEFPNMDSVPGDQIKNFVPSMFPPSQEDAEWMHLERSFRILPYTQNSGGFFLAVFKKIAPTSLVDEDGRELISKNWIPKQVSRKRRTAAYREDPFVFFDADQIKNVSNELSIHYGVDPTKFTTDNLLVRTIGAEKKNAIYFVNDRLRDFLKYNGKRFRIVNAGVQLLRRITKVSPCSFRLCQDGLRILSPFISKRIIKLPENDFVAVLLGSDDDQYLPWEKLESKNLFVGLDSGSVLLKLANGSLKKEVCGWMGAHTISAFINREDKIHILELLGANSEKLRRNAKTSRQHKADGGRPSLKQPKLNENVNNELDSNGEDANVSIEL